MNQLAINFEAVTNTMITSAPTARQFRSMCFENMIQASILNRELRCQESAARTEDVKTWQTKMSTLVP